MQLNIFASIMQGSLSCSEDLKGHERNPAPYVQEHPSEGRGTGVQADSTQITFCTIGFSGTL
jgi:hypothetical protein